MLLVEVMLRPLQKYGVKILVFKLELFEVEVSGLCMVRLAFTVEWSMGIWKSGLLDNGHEKMLFLFSVLLHSCNRNDVRSMALNA